MLFESLPMLLAGCFFVGLAQGLGQFYRFSAVEISPPKFKTSAVTYVLTGGILAAFLGPIRYEPT
jgi:predicted MFS family arabinose efflux permease